MYWCVFFQIYKLIGETLHHLPIGPETRFVKQTDLIDLIKRANPIPIDIRRKIELVFTYELPFSTLVFNYAKELRKIANSKLLASLLKSPCFCHDSAYIYTPFGHIVTGNLKMVHNNDLRSILAKGTKYRVPDYSMTNIISDFISGLDKLMLEKFQLGLVLHYHTLSHGVLRF